MMRAAIRLRTWNWVSKPAICVCRPPSVVIRQGEGLCAGPLLSIVSDLIIIFVIVDDLRIEHVMVQDLMTIRVIVADPRITHIMVQDLMTPSVIVDGLMMT